MKATNLTDYFTTEGIERLKNRLKKDRVVILTVLIKGKDRQFKVKVSEDNKVWGDEV